MTFSADPRDYARTAAVHEQQRQAKTFAQMKRDLAQARAQIARLTEREAIHLQWLGTVDPTLIKQREREAAQARVRDINLRRGWAEGWLNDPEMIEMLRVEAWQSEFSAKAEWWRKSIPSSDWPAGWTDEVAVCRWVGLTDDACDLAPNSQHVGNVPDPSAMVEASVSPLGKLLAARKAGQS